MTNATELLTLQAPVERRRLAQVEIVIPIYNEETTLEPSIRRLHDYLRDRFPLTWLVTIADNASTDRSWGIACRLATELDGVQAVHLDQKGRGRALRAAWLASEAPVVAYMDVDLSTDLDALLPLVAPLLSGHSDLAIGTRLASGSRVVRGPKREAISRSYNLLLKATLRSGFSDAQCGFKAIRSDVARVLLPVVEDEGWFFDTELLVLAEHNGLRIHEVPVDWIDDPDSRVNVVGTAKADLQGIWRMAGSILRGTASVRDLVPRDDAGLRSDLPSQLVRFASIGLVSSAVFAVLFAGLAPLVGALPADVVALAVCTLANTAANRRLTFSLRGRAGRARHYLAGLGLGALPLGLTLATLAGLDAIGVTALAPMLVALTAANLAAALGRFVLLRHWVFRDPDAPRHPIVGRLRQLVRYGTVSLISTSVSLCVLGTLVWASVVPAVVANVIATGVGTIPSFELNRRWVWGKTGRRSVTAEVGPFCVLSFSGLALSTLAVGVAAAWASSAGLAAGTRTLAVTAANLAAFGSLWILQFVLLDRVLFRHP